MHRPHAQDSQPIFQVPPSDNLEQTQADSTTFEPLDDKTSPHLYGGTANRIPAFLIALLKGNLNRPLATGANLSKRC